tara:strand:+ start:68 stop:253 length:186 start_codon:yes stop_codon:yes gene_type:complete
MFPKYHKFAKESEKFPTSVADKECNKKGVEPAIGERLLRRNDLSAININVCVQIREHPLLG